MIVEIVLLIVGLIIGIFLAWFYLRSRLAIQLEKWKLEYEDKLREQILSRSRATLKGRIGEMLAPLLPFFKYEPSDARFLGTPIDYIVFDGW